MEKIYDRYSFFSSLVVSGAFVSGACTLISAIFVILEKFHQSKSVFFFYEVFSTCVVLSTLYLSVVFFIWIYYLAKSFKAFGIKETASPVWAVVWFFIPIINLIKPYLIVREFWGVFNSDETQKNNNIFIKIWWSTFILSGIVSKVAIQMRVAVEDFNSLRLSEHVYLLSIILNIIYIVALLIFIKKFDVSYKGRFGENYLGTGDK